MCVPEDAEGRTRCDSDFQGTFSELFPFSHWRFIQLQREE